AQLSQTLCKTSVLPRTEFQKLEYEFGRPMYLAFSSSEVPSGMQ
ncbi:hypothetical protein A2U01_0090280, partial [Trifolium medium]|nr:hypothetical protein [Trifolium medium]